MLFSGSHSSVTPLYQSIIAGSIAALLLAGCGGGGDADAGAAAHTAQAAPAAQGTQDTPAAKADAGQPTQTAASSASEEDAAADAAAVDTAAVGTAQARPRTATTLVPTATTAPTSTTTSTTTATTTTTTTSASLPASLTCGLPNFQAEIMRLMNEARASSRYCGSTLYPAAAPLKWNSLLFNAAAGHSSDMAGKNYFSHTSLDGRTFSQRITAAGYAWRAAGENIAAGQTSIQSVMNGWLQSPGHCANIMKAAYTEVGVSCAQNSASTYKLYWTMDLAAPR